MPSNLRSALPRSFVLDSVVAVPIADRARFLDKLAWEIDFGSWPLAEAVTLTYLEQYPDDPQAWLLAAHLAWRVGLPTAEVGFLKKAARLAPANAAVKRRVAATRAAVRPAAPPGKRFLVAKAYGYGFWSDVTHVLGCALLAEIAGRVPVVHWGAGSRFGDGTDRDHFTDFFAPPSAETIDDVAAQAGPVYPPPYSPARLREDGLRLQQGPQEVVTALRLLGSDARTVVSDLYFSAATLMPFVPRDHPLAALPRGPAAWRDAYRHLAAKYLRPRAVIAEEARGFVRERLAGSFIAVHLRGTDKTIETGSDRATLLQREAFARIEAHAARDADLRFFVMTDDADLLAHAVQLLGPRAIYTEAARISGPEGVHNTGRFAGGALGREVLRDVLIAIEADAFIGTGTSNVSNACAYLRDWPQDALTLLDRPVFIDRPMVFGWDMPRLRALAQ